MAEHPPAAVPVSDRIVLPDAIHESEAKLPGLALGIDIPWRDTGDGYVTGLYEALPQHAGWDGVVHGGVTAYLVDEALAFVAAGQRGMVGMTVRLELRYLRPLLVGQTYVARGRVTDRREGLASIIEISVSDGQGPCLTAEGVYRMARAAAVRRLIALARRPPGDTGPAPA